MRIALVGAYGAGKTTLAQRLSARLDLPVAPTGPMADPVHGAARALGACGEDESFQLVLRRFGERSAAEARLAAGMISDGSIAHEWIYLRTLQREVAPSRRRVSAERFVNRALFEAVQSFRCRYDLILYVPVEHPLPPDATIRPSFQDSLDRMSRFILRHASVATISVSGSVEDRLLQTQEAVHAFR